MKVRFRRQELLAACQLLRQATAGRDSTPVLRNLKAVVESDHCTLMATDLELGIRLEVAHVDIEAPGEAMLSTHHLVAILREGTDEELTIEANPDCCVVRGQSAEFDMLWEDPSAFPDLPSFAEEQYHEVSAGNLREMIRRTIFATAESHGSRFGATQGVLWELEGSQAALITTDGRRLARAHGHARPHGGHTTTTQKPVVAVKALSLLDRLLEQKAEQVRISLRPNDVLFRTQHAMIYSRLVEGRFPDYRQVLPQKHPIKIQLTAGPFLVAVRQAAVMTDDDSSRVSFRFDKKKLTLQARGSETGRSRVEIPLDYDGPAIEISFDPKYLVDMLKVLQPDAALTLELLDSKTPALFRCGPDYLYLLVPLVTASQEAFRASA